jgi:hypothetical protein
MALHIETRETLLQIAVEWCRQTAVLEPGRLERLVTSETVAHGLSSEGAELRGAELETYYRQLASFYPARTCTVLDSIIEGDRVAVRWVMAFEPGLGDWRFNAGEVEGITILRIRDGRVLELWTNFGRWWV